jgi:hypothetical protein
MDTDLPKPTMPVRRKIVAGWLAVLLIGGLLAFIASPSDPSGHSLTEAIVVADDAPSTSTETTGASSTLEPTRSTAPTTTKPSASTTLPPTSTIAAFDPWEPAEPPPQDADDPAVVARSVPQAEPTESLPPAPPPPWAATRSTTLSGQISTDLGCAWGLGAGALDAFFASRLGPVLGWDYQHVYPLGGERFLWLFQDVFIDQSGAASTLGQSSFVHNAAVIQEGTCFRLLHGGTPDRPQPFEVGGGVTQATWFWPMGGEVHDGHLQIFWVKMVKDQFNPSPPDGLGWHPTETWLATYDPITMVRLDFRRAVNSGVAPIYGYAVASDATHTYLFANSFEQNLAREGGYWSGPHSGTRMYLARVPRGQLLAQPEYRTANGWTSDASSSDPILQRHWAEFPMQPRFIEGQWVAVAATDGYWGDWFSMDVARQPWGPWTTVEARPLQPRNVDFRRNTYHAHLAPWRDAAGNLVVTVSNNARNMLRDAWPDPSLYRPMVITSAWVVAPVLQPPTTTTSSTTSAPTTTTSPTTTTTTFPSPPTSTSTSTTTTPLTTTTSTAAPTSSTTSTTSTSTSTTLSQSGN